MLYGGVGWEKGWCGRDVGRVRVDYFLMQITCIFKTDMSLISCRTLSFDDGMVPWAPMFMGR